MIQEIITYLIIGFAFSFAGYKIVMKFGKVKKASTKNNKQTGTEHKCADCSAECMLRDSFNTTKCNDQNLFKKTESKKA